MEGLEIMNITVRLKDDGDTAISIKSFKPLFNTTECHLIADGLNDMITEVMSNMVERYCETDTDTTTKPS